ncbi:hypothetical protein GDO81_022799 [Engystomops pustulosus]|uniref:Ion transport domain-containing protein n=1 Tax=Engystomops pustulosus TaxID=76066 RepID=A0AAV6Z558_ENGPU|nr:hypothetical protein GDO81_022799 [Engystomops pustulosus]KAG8544276.1 hypothetical protein GDO81_022799 [Engystomops pustulosus]
MLLFFIYAALGVELFGKLVCNEENPCEGLSRHATFENFGMAFLTLFRVSTGDNWNGIMKDTLRECNSDDKHCLSYLPIISPVYFVTFVLIAQFVLVNVVVAVLMKHLEESNKEAKEDAEMDAEIELEMSRAVTPVCPTGSPNLDAKAIGGGPVSMKKELPVLLKQARDGDVYMRDGTGSQNLLTVRKVSVSRMLSLPNDSYMFRPVLPAKSSYPLREVDAYEDSPPEGSRLSVHSQPVESSYSLKTPVDCQPLPSPSCHVDNEDLPKIPPPRPASRSPSLNRLLRRQEAVHMDSVDYQNGESKDSLQLEPVESAKLKTPSPKFLGPNMLCPSPLSLQGTPQTSPQLSPNHRHSSIHTRNHTYSQHSIPSRPSSVSSDNTNPDESTLESSDPADEEVSHINSLATSWRGQSNHRSHSVSPFISQVSSPPSPPLLKNCNSTASLVGTSSSKDLKKFYSVDTQGFLAKPMWAEDQRRHSIEICPSIDDDGDSCFDLSIDDKQDSSILIQSDPEHINGVRRKKKMSPPCISIDPPMEDETGTASRTKASENSMLRRRTPSCESTAYRDSLDLSDNQAVEQQSKSERRSQAPCRNEHLVIPGYSFDQREANNFSELLTEGGHPTSPSVVILDSRPDTGTLEIKQIDHCHSNNTEIKSSLKNPALVDASNTSGEVTDKPL